MLFISAGHPCGWLRGLCSRSLLVAVTHIWGFAGFCGHEWHHPRCGTRLSGLLQRTEQALRSNIPLAVCAACHISLVTPVSCLLGTGLRPSKLVLPMALQGAAGQRWGWCFSLCQHCPLPRAWQDVPVPWDVQRSPQPAGASITHPVWQRCQCCEKLGEWPGPVHQLVLPQWDTASLPCLTGKPPRAVESLEAKLHSIEQNQNTCHSHPLCSSQGGGGRGHGREKGGERVLRTRNNSQK